METFRGWWVGGMDGWIEVGGTKASGVTLDAMKQSILTFKKSTLANMVLLPLGPVTLRWWESRAGWGEFFPQRDHGKLRNERLAFVTS